MIVGIFIFFTIKSYKNKKPNTPKNLDPHKAAAAVVIPFSASAVFELLRTVDYWLVHNLTADTISIALPAIGFVYVAILVTNLVRFGLVENGAE